MLSLDSGDAYVNITKDGPLNKGLFLFLVRKLFSVRGGNWVESLESSEKLHKSSL